MPEVRAFCAAKMESCGAVELGVSRTQLEQWLSEVLRKCGSPAGADCTKLLESLKLTELVLARACAGGNERAWEQFMARYRETLFSSAYKIAGNESRGRELADSLYAELYGINANGAERRSKLLYYHGRGSLEGWLRTVLAQDHVDRFRKTRRETSLDEQVEAGKQFAATPHGNGGSAHDERVDAATNLALGALSAEDRFVLASYFLDGRSLAEVAKLLRVHESTISRRIQKLVGGLRDSIEKHLVSGGMSARQVQEAMESADVRDLRVNIHAALQQEKQRSAFYKSETK